MENLITVDYESLVKETELAWGLEWDDVEDTVWFPKSQCDIDEFTCTIDVPEWLWIAKQREHEGL